MQVNVNTIITLLATRTEACVPGTTLVGAAAGFRATAKLSLSFLARALGEPVSSKRKETEAAVLANGNSEYFWQVMCLMYGPVYVADEILPRLFRTNMEKAYVRLAEAVESFYDWPWGGAGVEKISCTETRNFAALLMERSPEAYFALEVPSIWAAKRLRTQTRIATAKYLASKKTYHLDDFFSILYDMGDYKLINEATASGAFTAWFWLGNHVDKLECRNNPDILREIVIYHGFTDSRFDQYLTPELRKEIEELAQARQDARSAKLDRNKSRIMMNSLSVAMGSRFADQYQEGSQQSYLENVDFVYHCLMGGHWNPSIMSHPLAGPATLVAARMDGHINREAYTLLMQALFGKTDPELLFTRTKGNGYFKGNQELIWTVSFGPASGPSAEFREITKRRNTGYHLMTSGIGRGFSIPMTFMDYMPRIADVRPSIVEDDFADDAAAAAFIDRIAPGVNPADIEIDFSGTFGTPVSRPGMVGDFDGE